MGCMICHQDHAPLQTCGECEFDAFVRNHFFTGKMMGAAEFATETLYHSDKMRHHNARLHGAGVVCGLKVGPHPQEGCRKRYVVVYAGSALDCCGREILVAQDEIVDVAHHASLLKALEEDRKRALTRLHTLQLCVAYRDCPTEDVPILYDECGCDDTKCAPNRILESFRFDVLVDPPLAAAELSGATPLGAFVSTELHRLTGFSRASAAGKVLAADPADPKRLFLIDTRYRSMKTIALADPARAAALSADGKFVFAVVQSKVRIFKVEDGSEITPTGTNFNLPAAVSGAVAGAAGTGENGFLVYDAAGGDVYRWKADGTDGLANAAANVVTLNNGSHLTGMAAAADGSVLYGIRGNSVCQFTLSSATVNPKVFTATAAPSALATLTLGANALLAVASHASKQVFLVDFSASPPAATKTIDLDKRPLHLGAAVDPVPPATADDVWLHVLEEDSGHLYTQAVSLKPLTANPVGEPLIAAPRPAADGARVIALVFPEGQAGLVHPAALADSDCAEQLWMQLEGCPGCELPDCVVLATITNYRQDMPLTDEDIDNRLGRRMVASTATLQAWLQCLHLKGGIPGPKGEDGEDGENGDDGDDGLPGNDGAGLETGLTRIVATSWVHAHGYVLDPNSHAYAQNDSPLVPIKRQVDLTPGSVATPFGQGLVIGFSGEVNAPDITKQPYPLPVFEVMVHTRAQPPAPTSYTWNGLYGLILPVATFTQVGNRITDATIVFPGQNTPPTAGKGLAFIVYRTAVEALEGSPITLVRLRGDFIVDVHVPGRALDAEFARAQFPTGDGPAGTSLGLQGGIFESWFGSADTEQRNPTVGTNFRASSVPVNSATVFELALVPGVGMQRAEEIVAAREARPNKRFSKFDDLRGVGGINTALLNTIKPHLKLG